MVEIDGGYHDEAIVKDLRREEDLRQRGWTVIRFSDDEVENDAESVGRAIADKRGIPYEFTKRQMTGSGMRSVKATKMHTPT